MIIIDNIDLTKYVNKNGLTEDADIILKSQYETARGASVSLPKGFHGIYSINLSNVEESLKTSLESLCERDAVSCNINDYIFNCSVDTFYSSIDIVFKDLKLYNVKMTISDNELTKEEGSD